MAALSAVPATAPASSRTTSNSGGAGIVHIVAPGDVLNPGALRSGYKIMQRMRGVRECALWTQSLPGVPDAPMENAMRLDAETGNVPASGELMLCGPDARILSWLPRVASAFASIQILLDAHDPPALVAIVD